MTTNQTIDGVPRELVCMTIDLLQVLLRGTAVERRLRALLDKEVSGDSRAPQHQREPVAWLNVATGHVTTSAVVVMDWDDEKEQVLSLCAEQPAPVAVVLPERKSVNTHNSHDWDEGHAGGWVAYDTELKRLNPSL